MRTVADIFFSVTGQSLYFDAPEGRPSSVTSVSIFPWDASDDADSEWSATGAVEEDPDTTIFAESGVSQADPRNILVAETDGFALGRSYLITSDEAFFEWFEVIEIAVNNSVIARHPLHNIYPPGCTVQSTRITADVDSTWVADSTNLRDDAGPNPAYRVRWVYVVGAETFVADSYFNLVRYAGTHGVTPQDVEATAPGWLDRLPTDHRKDQGRRLIDEAYRAVKIDLAAIWTDDAMVANTEVIDELTRWKCLELGTLALVMDQGGDTARLDVARDAYQRRFDSLSRITNKLPIRDVDGAAQKRPAIGLSVR